MALVRPVFMIVGLHFSLRGGQEHRDLVIEQLQRFPVDHGCYDDTSTCKVVTKLLDFNLFTFHYFAAQTQIYNMPKSKRQVSSSNRQSSTTTATVTTRSRGRPSQSRSQPLLVPASYYEYVERGSNNYQGRFAEIDCNKMVCVYAQPGSSRCPVSIIDLYLKKLPANPKALYMQPLTKVPTDPYLPWFQNCPIGINFLKNMMSNISKLCGLDSRYTNHSLRATAATRMFAAGVPEKIIADRTGHKSAKGLRQYEKVSTTQLQAAGLAVSDCKPFMSLENTLVEADMTKQMVKFTKTEESEAPRVEEKADCLRKVLPTFAGNMKNAS